MATSRTRAADPPSTMAMGVATAAAVMLALAGVLNAVQGVVALVTNEFFVVTQEWLFEFTVTTWGWIHIVLGIIGVATAAALTLGKLSARIFGIILAGVSVLMNFLWLPYYPLWAIIIIAVGLFVMWALTMYGQEFENE